MDSSFCSQKAAMVAKPNKSKQKSSISPRDYRNMSKDDLRQELRKRGVKISGKKADLENFGEF